MARRSHQLLVVLLMTLAGPSVLADEAATSLFNGTLDGWVQRGGNATYAIEGDVIVGTSVAGTPNTFLCTAKKYGDFVLELDVKVDDGLNSGIQIRSECYDTDHDVEVPQRDGTTKKMHFPAGLVHGYQVEIDASPRAWSGGIYDEGRRGWLDDLSADEDAKAREAFRGGEWNHYRVEAKGTSLKVWVNGIPAANVTDSATAKGFIALQVHAVGDKKDAGKHVRWKNIKLSE